MDLKADLVIVGGGLAGCLTALRFAVAKPDLHVILIEQNDRLGGHRTWCFHDSELGIGSPESQATSIESIKPLLFKTWSETEIKFPRIERVWPGSYHAIRSEDLHAQVIKRLGDDVLLKSRAERISESHVELANGDIIAGRCVLDARGFDDSNDCLRGYQKSIAIDFLLEQPHGLKKPVLMDSTSPQLDGYRFFNTLPLDDKRLRIEEVYFSDTADLNADRVRRSLHSYVERRGWKATASEREESVVIPMPMTSSYIRSSVGGEPLPIGMRGGYFHATTGCVLAESARIAEFLVTLDDLTTQAARSGLMRTRRPWLSRQRFYRLINRLIFYASEPSLRYMVLQRLFEQPPDLVERFFSGRTTWRDRFRIVTGRPPIPLDRALRSLSEKSFEMWADNR